MTDQTADTLTAQANALYAEALAQRKLEDQAAMEAAWTDAGTKADHYWDLLDRQRPAARTTAGWLAIHTQQVTDGTAPHVPAPAVFTFAQLCHYTILCQEDGLTMGETMVRIAPIAVRSGLTGDQLADALACYEDDRTGQ